LSEAQDASPRPTSQVRTRGRVKAANALAVIGNYLGTPSQDRFDDSDFKHTKARNWPEIPGEAQRNIHLMETKRQYNQYEELDPEFSSSYLGEPWRYGAYDPSDLEEDNKAVTHQQAAEPVRITAERGQEYEEHFRGWPGNQFFTCKYCSDLQGEFGFWQFDHLKLHMKTKHNREMESESPISKRKVSINGKKYEKDDQQAGAADRAVDGPENEARMVPSEIDVEDQAAPLLGRQDQLSPPALHTPPPLQITESSSSKMKVITSSGGHHLGSSRTDPWSSSEFVEEEEDEGWDRDEDNRDGSIRGEDVQENIYTTSAPVFFAPETISYEDGAIETKSSTARESLSKHYRATASGGSGSPAEWAKLKEPISWDDFFDDEDRHETDRGSNSISSHSQNLNTIESELAEVAKMAKVDSTPGVRTEPADSKVDFEASIAAMRAETERGKAEDAQAAADNALLTAEAARDVSHRHDERLPKADSFLEAATEHLQEKIDPYTLLEESMTIVMKEEEAPTDPHPRMKQRPVSIDSLITTPKPMRGGGRGMGPNNFGALTSSLISKGWGSIKPKGKNKTPNGLGSIATSDKSLESWNERKAKLEHSIVEEDFDPN
jgi:hypothetical protein